MRCRNSAGLMNNKELLGAARSFAAIQKNRLYLICTSPLSQTGYSDGCASCTSGDVSPGTAFAINETIDYLFKGNIFKRYCMFLNLTLRYPVMAAGFRYTFCNYSTNGSNLSFFCAIFSSAAISSSFGLLMSPHGKHLIEGGSWLALPLSLICRENY